MSSIEKLFVCLFVVVVALVAVPAAFIWSLNNLFGLSIEFTFFNHVSSLFLLLVLGAYRRLNKI